MASSVKILIPLELNKNKLYLNKNFNWWCQVDEINFN